MFYIRIHNFLYNLMKKNSETKIEGNDKNTLVESIYDIYYRTVFAYVNSLIKNVHDAEDITIDAFGDLLSMKYEKLISIKIRPYLFQMVRNKVYDFIRKEEKKKNRIVSISNLDYLKDPYYTENQVMKLEREEDQKKLTDSMLQNLGAKQRFAINRWMHGFSHKEIAKELNMTQSNVSALISRGLKKIRNII